MTLILRMIVDLNQRISAASVSSVFYLTIIII